MLATHRVPPESASNTHEFWHPRLVAVLDFVTGYELHFVLFYFVPVALIAWQLGRAAGILMAIVASIVWYSGGPVLGAAVFIVADPTLE